MVKLTLRDSVLNRFEQVQDVKLFIRHLLLGLSGNNTLTDLTLDLRSYCWDWPQGVLNELHCLKEVVVQLAYLYVICVTNACSLLLKTV